MTVTRSTPGDCTDAIPFPTLASGTDAANGVPLSEAVERWLASMRAKKKRDNTIAVYRQQVQSAMRLRGWTAVGDIAGGEIEAHLEALALEKGWKGATFNRNLMCFRSLTRFLHRTGMLSRDPLFSAETAENDGEYGSRAATTDEAKALILHAWIRQQGDRRCNANRALYWACLFAHGCRASEPGRWRRRHLMLEHEVPHVDWTKDINKCRRREQVALAPELVVLLREQLETEDQLRLLAGIGPAGPDSPVFPRVPSHPVFAADRLRAGIEHKDPYGRIFSRHSARKWFETTLVDAGVHSKLVNKLIRHQSRETSSGVDDRYYLPSLERQAQALERLPRLWPEARVLEVVHKELTGRPVELTEGPRSAQDVASTLGFKNTQTTSDQGLRRARAALPSVETVGAIRGEALVRDFAPGSGEPPSGPAGQVGSRVMDPAIEGR